MLGAEHLLRDCQGALEERPCGVKPIHDLAQQRRTLNPACEQRRSDQTVMPSSQIIVDKQRILLYIRIALSTNPIFMTDLTTAEVERSAAPPFSEFDSLRSQDRHNTMPNSVEFDVDYSRDVEFVIRIGSPATARLIFKDEEGATIAGPISGGMVINDAPATFTATLSAHGQSVLIVPIALGSTILRYVYCRCLTASLIVRITNRVGPLRPCGSIRRNVLDYLQAVNFEYQPRTIEDIIGCVGADRGSIEGALERLVKDGFVRQSGEFWQPLNPASASSSFD